MTRIDGWTKDDRLKLRSDALDLLPGPNDDPISSNDLARRLGLNQYEQGALLWPALDWLARNGRAERIVRPDFVCRFWRRTDTREADQP